MLETIIITVVVFLLAVCWLAILVWAASRETREIEARLAKGATGPHCIPPVTEAERSFLVSMLGGRD